MKLTAQIMLGSRYFILFAVYGTLFASIGTIVYSSFIALISFVEAIESVLDGSLSEAGSHHLAVGVLNSVDIMLLGTVLYLTAFGLYFLFINPNLDAPAALRVKSIEELKVRLLAVVIVMIAVNFVAYLVEWNGTSAILDVGLAIGAVYVGLGVVLLPFRNRRPEPESDDSSGDQ